MTSPIAGCPPVVFLFVVAFPAAWLFGMYFASRTSGWSVLAERYRSDEPFWGTMFRFQSANCRWSSHYNGCLTFGVNTQGLYIVPMLIFRAFHPPLLIPWNDITARPMTMWLFFRFIELEFDRAPEVPFRIRESLARKIEGASVGRFRQDMVAAEN